MFNVVSIKIDNLCGGIFFFRKFILFFSHLEYDQIAIFMEIFVFFFYWFDIYKIDSSYKIALSVNWRDC